MTVPLQSRAYTEQYASAIAALWEYYQNISDPSFALKNDIDAWEMCLRHPAFYQGTQQRLNDVAGPEWRVFPGNSSKDPRDILLAKVVEDALRSIRDFSGARKRQAHAIFRGSSCELITGKKRRCKLAGFPGDWWVPTKLEHVDPRRFKVVPRREKTQTGSTRVRGDLYISTIPQYNAPSQVNRPETGLYGYAPIRHEQGCAQPEWFLRTVYDDEESRLGFGRGIMDCLYFWVWTSTIVDREGLQGLERWAQGLVVGKVDAEARGDTGQPSSTMRDELRDELLKHRGRGVFVVDKRDEVAVVTGGGEGHGMVKDWQDRIDSKIIGVCTGAILSSAAGSDTGSYASDKVGSEIQNSVIEFDRNKMDEDLSEDLIGAVLRYNQPMIHALGLSQAARPEFRTIQRKTYNPAEAATRVATLKQAGIDLRADEVYEQTGFTPPAPGDKIIKGTEQQTAPNPLAGWSGLGQPVPAMPQQPPRQPQQPVGGRGVE